MNREAYAIMICLVAVLGMMQFANNCKDRKIEILIEEVADQQELNHDQIGEINKLEDMVDSLETNIILLTKDYYKVKEEHNLLLETLMLD